MRVEVESGAIAAFYLYVQNVERVREPRIPKGWSTKLQSTVKTETHEFNLALCLCRLMDKFQFEPANIEEALSEAILRFAEDISIRNMWRKVRQQLRDNILYRCCRDTSNSPLTSLYALYICSRAFNPWLVGDNAP